MDAYDGYEEYVREEPYAERRTGTNRSMPTHRSPRRPRSRRGNPNGSAGPSRGATAVILCCIAGLLFCAVEIYRIAHSVVQSETELRKYRELYLKEHNEDFMNSAQAVALRPPGETYPPTASPVPVQRRPPPRASRRTIR